VARPGPSPLPTHLRILRGETRPSRLNSREPKPSPKNPNPPTWLAREAKAEWRRLMRGMVPGLLTPLDRQVMSVAAESWARWTRATRLVDKLGIVVEGDRGLVKNPAIQIARDAEATMRGCWAELGLSPAARSRLEMPESEDPSAGPEGLLS
jgi:P27 family predicted phage terminase small subunit